jgi:4-amino-4-deoxy-L-arabinose transferase-like glycosyltransferase
MNLLKILKNSFYSKKEILLIFFISAFSRAIIAYFYGDRSLENEWAILVTNLYNFDSFSLLNFDDLYLPNLWMPPIYGYFVYIHALIFGLNENLASYVIATQIIISSITPIIFYMIIFNFFSKNLSLFGALIFSLFPLIVYSASQISSASIYLFLLLGFIYLVLDLSNKKSFKIDILIGVLAGILILTRRDFMLVYIFSLFYLLIFLKINYKKIFIIFIISIVSLSPYLIRNFIAFDKLIIHSGFGYNVWKAYNPNAKVEGYYYESNELTVKISKVKKDIYYRINEDKIYLEEAKTYIANNPGKYIKLFFKRLFSFYFLDLNSSQDNYYNFFHIYPNFFLSVLSCFGFIVCYKKDFKYNYLILTMFAFLFIYSLFALLPRYKLYILPFQIILSLSFIDFLIKKLSKNN